MNAMFVAYGLSDIVGGTSVMPGDAESAAGKKWIKDNAKAMCLVASSVEDNQLDSLLTCGTAREMWAKLGSIHEQKSASNKLLLLQKFHEYRMNPNESVVQHVACVQNMATQLKDVGEKISDAAIMAKVLGSLPSRYNALQTAWDSVSEDSQSLENLLERLIKEEKRLEGDDGVTRALAALSVGGKQKQVTVNTNKDGGKSRDKNKADAECFYCKKKGHYARECHKKKRDKKDGKGEEKSRDCAFVATSGPCVGKQGETSRTTPSSEETKQLMAIGKSDVWITDSGASRHITYRRDWYSDFRPSSGESISLGDNGVCEVIGTGTIIIDKLVNGEWHEARIEDVLYVPKVKKNLFSVGVCTSKGFEVVFKKQNVIIYRNREIVASGVKQDNEIYRMFFKVKSPRLSGEINVSTSLKVWHERMGHVNDRVLRQMAKRDLIRGFTNQKSFLMSTISSVNRVLLENLIDWHLERPKREETHGQGKSFTRTSVVQCRFHRRVARDIL